MKKQQALAVLTISSCLLLSACNKHEDHPAQNANNQATEPAKSQVRVKTDLEFDMRGNFTVVGISTVKGGQPYNPGASSFDPPVPLRGEVTSFQLNGIDIVLKTNALEDSVVKTRDFGDIKVLVSEQSFAGIVVEYHAYPSDIEKIKKAFASGKTAK